MACDQVGPGGCSAGRMSYGAYAAVVVVAAAEHIAAVAAAVAATQTSTLAADVVGVNATSMDSVANEGGRKKARHRQPKVKGEERAGGNCDVEA